MLENLYKQHNLQEIFSYNCDKVVERNFDFDNFHLYHCCICCCYFAISSDMTYVSYSENAMYSQTSWFNISHNTIDKILNCNDTIIRKIIK